MMFRITLTPESMLEHEAARCRRLIPCRRDGGPCICDGVSQNVRVPLEVFPIRADMPWSSAVTCFCGDTKEWTGADPSVDEWADEHIAHVPDQRPLMTLRRVLP